MDNINLGVLVIGSVAAIGYGIYILAVAIHQHWFHAKEKHIKRVIEMAGKEEKRL